jgi:lysophospholipase L1-like esterase
VPETDVALGAEEREMLRRVLVWATMVAALMVVPAVAAAATGAAKSPAKPGPTPRYYVALGDSLSQGMQPDAKGLTVDTDDGYVDDIGARALKRIPTLQVIKLGCGGDTTTSLLTGKGNDAAAKALHCDRQGGSQLAAAVSFLKSHHAAGEVPLITIDIGANDLAPCLQLTSATAAAACANPAIATVKLNTARILASLHAADPQGAIIGMTYYVPQLAEWLSGAAGRAYTASHLPLVEAGNAALTSDFKASRARVADVFAAFKSSDLSGESPLPGLGSVPTAVALICAWTWACAAPPVGPNAHANATGYGVIAATFDKVLPDLP